MFLANHVIDGVLCAYPRCYSWGCQNNMDVCENLARLVSEFVETNFVTDFVVTLYPHLGEKTEFWLFLEGDSS